MLKKNNLNNPVNLKELKSKNLLENMDYNFILKNDIWKQGILILRSGKYLTNDIINKLINFGIEEISIHLNYDDFDEDEYNAYKELKRNFMQTQTLLIIDKEFKNISYLAKILMDFGFKDKNIYALTNTSKISQYYQSKKPSYLFIDYSQYQDSLLKTINNTQNSHLFLTIQKDRNNTENLQNIENKTDYLDLKVLFKPVIVGHLKHLINQCIDNDFCRLLKNEAHIDNHEIKLGA